MEAGVPLDHRGAVVLKDDVSSRRVISTASFNEDDVDINVDRSRRHVCCEVVLTSVPFYCPIPKRQRSPLLSTLWYQIEQEISTRSPLFLHMYLSIVFLATSLR